MNTEHYKSWSGLKKQLTERLCDELQGRIDYFLTYYHKVHNSYGRASIRLDGRDIICFSWIEMYHQDQSLNRLYNESGIDYADATPMLKDEWDENQTYSEGDFLAAVTAFRSLSVEDALSSDDYIVRILAILDRRVGKRRLAAIRDAEEYLGYPSWVREFYRLRLSACGLIE